jgi:cellulose synthase/poly-beta-1,6-N-acetylglucosamine synthase-like glycosyltransferase
LAGTEAERTFARRLAEAQAFGAASNGLPIQNPALSARDGLSVWQRLFGWAAVAAYAVALFGATAITLATTIVVLAGLFLVLILIRLLAVASALASRRSPKARAFEAGGVLPLITLLIPLYREADVLPDLIAAIGDLDYPADRLDVKLLIEADDGDTLRVAHDLLVHRRFEVIPVPPGQPRTKPKALNYGLHFARGDLVAIFDAEDRPARGQLRAAVEAFRSGDRRLAVVQAPLSIHNGKDGWLAAQFEIEYAIHFRVWLPFLARIGAPLALGGTSNYFRRDTLVEAGGWDAWNVTEDADIGLRLARLGYRATMIAPPTAEEAPAKLRPWLNQRTRWMKGYLQTWLVLNRTPFRTARGMGAFNYLLTQITLGGALVAAMAHAPLLVWTLASAVMLSGIEAWHVGLFLLGYGSAVVAAIVSRARHANLPGVLTLPLYWPLQSIAMARALFEMKDRPHHWAKTPHKAYKAPTFSGGSVVEQEAPRPDDNVIQLPLPF